VNVNVNAVTDVAHARAGLKQADEGTGANKLGVFFLVAFLFLGYSRLTDSYLQNLYLPLVFSILALLAAVFTGGLQRAFGSRAGMWLTAFTAWLILAVPFSFWPGGSVQFLWGQWLKSFLVFVIVAGVPRSVKEVRLALYSIAAATIVIGLMCLFLGTTSAEGRLALSEGVLANSNDLAQLLLMGAPFLLLMGMGARRIPVRRAMVAASIVGVLLVTAATGSRGALTAFTCLMLLMFVNLPGSAKVKLLCAVAVIGPLLALSLSAEQRARYLTIFGSQPDADQIAQVSAVESTEQRLALLTQSIQMTVTHPLFGVGPGVFQAASANESTGEGMNAMWRETHNAYTQLSSEAGVPALAFYLAALIGCMWRMRLIYRTALTVGMEDLANVAYCLFLALISFATTSFFSSVAYHMYFPTLAGLSVALGRSAQSELESA
jgi:O-antigen ligase